LIRRGFARDMPGMALRIGIVGAGIGGLAAAALLARRGHAVTLAERFAVPRPLGSGLVVQPVGLAVLDEIGAGAAARALASPIRRMRGHAGGREILTVDYRAGAPGLAMHRASLFHVLWQAAEAAGVTMATGATVLSAPLTGAERLLEREAAGRLGPFDLVVDASGAGSRLSPLRARVLPFGAVWASVPWPEGSVLPTDQLTQRYLRADRMAGVLPIGCLPHDPTPRAALFWSLPLAGLDGWPDRDFDEWRGEVGRFWPEMVPHLAQLRDKADLTPARYSHGNLTRVHAPALVFLGDAAWRASPQLGQGANMALLDAMALALALDACPLAEALPRYAATRRWHRRFYQLLSASFTPMYQSHGSSLPLLRDRILAPLGRLPPVDRLLSALVSGDLLPPIASTRWP
jgi:2-polyprenyl-6-methoxyphenol hydroxylase-like FAD-dependent oxidoreductase